MRNMLLTALACALFLGCSDQSGAPLAPGDARRSAVTTTESVSMPIDIGLFVPCTNGGLGETVYLSGSLHTVAHVTIDGAGGFHMIAQTHYQGMSGLGVETGDSYHVMDNSQNEYNGQVGEEVTFVNNFGIVGQGPGNNYQAHYSVHFNVDPDGNMTMWVDNFHSDCK